MRIFYIYVLVLSLGLTACSQQLSTEEYVQQGEQYIAKKDWKSAIIEFRNAVKQSPDNAQARALLGESYLQTNSSNAAIKELKKAIELGVNMERVALSLAKAFAQLNQNKEIVAEIIVDPSYSDSVQADLLAIRSTALLRLNQQEKAKRSLDHARLKDENATEVRLAWALYEKIEGNQDAQREWLTPLLERDGGIAEAWSQIAELEQTNDVVKAEEAYTRAIKLRAVVHVDYVKRALLRISQSNYDGARDDLSVLKKAGASWPIVGHAEGLLAYHQGKYDLAQSLFEKVLSTNPDYSPTQLLVGMTHFHKGNYQNSITNLEIYLSAFPDAHQANFIYAASLLKQKKILDAIAVLEKLNSTHPDNYRVLSLLGNAYLQNNQNEQGIQTLKKVVILKPDQAQTRLQLGAALLRDKAGVEVAQLELIKAIELDPELHQADLALYMSYMRNKEYASAKQVAQVLKQKQPDSTLGANLIAISYFSDGKKQQGIAELKKALASFPADPLTSDNLAKVYLQEDRLDEVKLLYLDVLKKNPTYVKAYNQLALIAARQNNRSAVLDWLKKSVDHNPDNLSAKLLLATQFLRENDSNRAIQLLQGIKAEDKKTPQFILLMAKAKMSVGEHQHAVTALKSLLAEKPELTSGHILLAQAYAQLNQKDSMRKTLEIALKHAPDSLPVHLMLARLDLLDNKIEEFKRRVSMLMKSYPDSRDVQFLNAKIQSSEQGYERAIKTLSEIMTETPHSDVVIDLAKNQWAGGDKDAAISGLELWLQDNATDKKALMVIAQFYLAENRTVEAKKTYQTLDTQLPDNSIVLNNLAWLMKEADVEQGIVYAKKALQIDPKSPFIQDTLAMLLLEKGELSESLNLSRKAASQVPGLTDIQLNLARILVANNEKNEAKQLLSRLLNKERDYDKRKVIQAELDRL